MALKELNQAAIFWSSQTAKGTPATTAAKKGRWVGGNVGGNVTMAEEPYADGSRFNSSVQFADQLQGGGAPGIQGQSGTLAHLLWAFLGTETVTGTGPYVHTVTPSGVSKYMTWWTSVGSSVATKRRHNDCRPQQVVIAGATDQKVVRLTPTLISLDPDEIVATDPVKTDDGTVPMLYTEGSASYTINGTVYSGHSAFTITLSDALTAVYGDSVHAFDVANGLGAVTLDASLYLDSAGQALVNTLKYGTASPSTGAKPQQAAPSVGTYSFNLARGATEAFGVTFAGVTWSIPDEPEPSPQGGTPVISLTGRATVVASNPIVSFQVKNADAAYTA
jgi:hypothetical protein